MLKKNSRSNYNIYDKYEEKKEDNYVENDVEIYNNFQMDGIINDLKKKGFNDFQINDIIMSIKKNNNNTFQNKKMSQYNSFNQDYKRANIKKNVEENKIKDYNSFKHEPEIKQRNKLNKYNTKIYISNNINEIKYKILNENMKNKKFSEKINYEISKPLLRKAKKEPLIQNNDKNTINSLLQNTEDKKTRNVLNIPLRGVKNVFNNYSFYDSNEKKNKNKNLNGYDCKLGKVHSQRMGKITKYTNKKIKNIDIHSNNRIDNVIIDVPFMTQNSDRSYSKNDKNFILKIDKENQLSSHKFKDNNNLNNEYKLDSKNSLDKQNSVRQLNHYFYYIDNNKRNYQNINNNVKENKIKIINIDKNCKNTTLNADNKNNSQYNNCNFHDISNNKSANKSFNNAITKIKLYYNNHNDINIYVKNSKKNANIIKAKNNNIENSARNPKINKPFNEIKNIKLAQNFELNNKKISHNNISFGAIYDLKNHSRVREPIHNPMKSLNIEHNNISISFEPSKNINEINSARIKNEIIQKENNFEFSIKPNNNRNNLMSKNKNGKTRNFSENKNVLAIDNKSELNFISNKKHFRDGKYEGILINGKREKKGIMKYRNGGTYEGEWKNDKRHGKGIFISQNYNNPSSTGIKYEGEFNNDKIEGYGIGKYSSGDTYEGEWKNNKQYGRGVLNYVGGGKYIGEWKYGQLNGEGIYYLKNGERFEGRFEDNKYNGYGKYYYNNGEYLEGIFKDDLPTGNCILHKIDGTTEDRNYG